MKISNWIAAVFAFAGMTANGQIIVADNYNISGSGTGFALNAGVNTGINPPTTRLTGTAASNLRYFLTATTKVETAFGIVSNKLRVTPAANPGRFTLSTNGIVPFDFASVLNSTTATPQNPVVYDIAISMANSSAGSLRTSFALAAAEGDATTWDFGIQIYRASGSDNFYTIGKRIDTTASGLGADLNTFIIPTAPGTYGTEINFLIRVTDAGAETTTFNSRVQVSLDGGLNWFYDTETDSDLPSGWRLNGAGRYILWDVAPDAGNVTYDNFSVRPVPVTATLISPANNAQGLGASVNLQAAVSNTLPGNLTVTFFGREAPVAGAGADFCIAVLPDTQNYAREASGSGNATKEMWFAQTEWIVTNRVSKNIAYVATLGDCVQNADSNTEWRNATNAMYRLENPARTLLSDGIPYGITVGNHDQDPAGDPDGSTARYNQYFGISHFQNKSYYGGHYDTNNDSWYDLFSAGGMDFIVISFEYGRYGSFIMGWANDVLAAHPNRRVIVLTHHAGSDSTPSNHSNQGEAIYEGLKANTNFFLMMSGHVFNGSGEGEGRRTNTFSGNRVYTLVSDYQGRFNGGNGLMRLMYFSPSNNLVSVKTYSPHTGAFETDSNSEFTLPYNMQPNGAGSPNTPFVALGTNSTVAPGTQSSLVWPGLSSSKTYEWYVNVTDEFGNQLTSSIRTFGTTVNSAPIVTNRVVTVIGDRPTQVTLQAFDANGDALTFQTNSRPIRGLNTEFDAVAGTITYLPAHGYRGLDRFTFRAYDSVAFSAVANLDLSVIAPADADTDGLPDGWELQYGISDSTTDDDSDGHNNLAEYLANTNPTNATSVLKILDVVHTNDTLALSWSAIGGTRYRVQYSDGDASGGLTNSFTDLVRFIDTEMNSSNYGLSSTQSFTETLPQNSTNTARYFRIKVVP